MAKITTITSSLAVAHSATIGSDLTTRGSLTVDHDLKVNGLLEAPNLKTICKGLFQTLTDLQTAYPRPQPGWMALVGTTLPADVYVENEYGWVATGEKGGELLAPLDYYETQIATLCQGLQSLEAMEVAERVEWSATGYLITWENAIQLSSEYQHTGYIDLSDVDELRYQVEVGQRCGAEIP